MSETAMLLTQEEWEDVAAMLRVFKVEGDEIDDAVYERRVRLADRIIDAAKPL